VSGNCVDSTCCNGVCSGSCNACNVVGNEGSCVLVSAGSVGAPSCAPYVCSGASAVCPGSCAQSSDCSSGNFCQASACVPQKANGATCVAAVECQSQNCVDGYC
jgi:hypothetical protein